MGNIPCLKRAPFLPEMQAYNGVSSNGTDMIRNNFIVRISVEKML